MAVRGWHDRSRYGEPYSRGRNEKPRSAFEFRAFGDGCAISREDLHLRGSSENATGWKRAWERGPRAVPRCALWVEEAEASGPARPQKPRRPDGFPPLRVSGASPAEGPRCFVCGLHRIAPPGKEDTAAILGRREWRPIPSWLGSSRRAISHRDKRPQISVISAIAGKRGDLHESHRAAQVPAQRCRPAPRAFSRTRCLGLLERCNFRFPVARARLPDAPGILRHARPRSAARPSADCARGYSSQARTTTAALLLPVQPPAREDSGSARDRVRNRESPQPLVFAAA